MNAEREDRPRVTRFAPSPTGALHLGNARTFLVNWLMARQRGWKVILRIEDLDGPRVKKGADRQAIDDLHWLGMDWEEGPIYQSSRMDHYAAAIEELVQKKLAYPCVCSRSEVGLAASAPHAEDGATVYPGTCRGRFESIAQAREASGREPAIRFAVGDAVIQFDDEFAGHHQFDMNRLGDFVIAKADGTPAYQLAVVMDDAEMGVTDVVRADDLIDSTPRQIMLYRALGLNERIPKYCHLPLVIGEDGRRLAKRHGDTRLSHYRQLGVKPGRVLKLLARWCGFESTDVETAADLAACFDLSKMSAKPIVFTQADDAWLKGHGN
ncbi:MAG TPA: glutamate--tRNA ligase [Tepidisphaeraceae bacterium]|nr:glutamate--tRNA ligase [Tepidisphaeraceae bacterium]